MTTIVILSILTGIRWDDALLPPDAQAAAELAAAAVAAEELLTAWTCAQSVLSMIVRLPSTADALAAVVAVARMLRGDGMSSVTAQSVDPALAESLSRIGRWFTDAPCGPPFHGADEKVS